MLMAPSPLPMLMAPLPPPPARAAAPSGPELQRAGEATPAFLAAVPTLVGAPSPLPSPSPPPPLAALHLTRKERNKLVIDTAKQRVKQAVERHQSGQHGGGAAARPALLGVQAGGAQGARPAGSAILGQFPKPIDRPVRKHDLTAVGVVFYGRCVWCDVRVYGQRGCTVSEGVRSARVYGQRGCTVSKGVWSARVYGQRGCMVSEGVWSARVYGQRGLISMHDGRPPPQRSGRPPPQRSVGPPSQ